MAVTAVVGVVMSLRLNDGLGDARTERDKARDAVQEGQRKLFESYCFGSQRHA